MTDRARRGRDKDASTRFMRVDQLFGGKTVEVPAATMLARAAASEARRPAAARREEPPTVAMPIATAKTLPATTVLQRPGASPLPHAACEPEKPAGAAWRPGPAGRRIALVTALAVTGALIHVSARRGASEPTAITPVVAEPTMASAAPALPAAVSSDARAAKAVPRTTTAPVAAARASLPSTAADQLAAGDHAAALDSYRELARLWPEERVYSVVVEVIEHRLSARCVKDASPGAVACER